MNLSSEKDDLPLVTIVTPSYNQAQFIEETILSVVNQDYPRIEFLVIDGASTDGSQKIIQEYDEEISWWVSEKDSGQSEAVNKGFARSSGEIVGWLNSDDIYLKDAIRKAVDAFIANPGVGTVYGNMLSIDENTRVFNTIEYDTWQLEDIMQFRIIGQPAAFVRKEVLERAGYLDPSYHLLLDQHFWVRIAAEGKMLHIDEYLAGARHHSSAKNVSQSPHYHKEVARVVEWMSQSGRLKVLFEKYEGRIRAGASTFNARYLMDGGLFREAFREYHKAIRYYPPVPLREIRRILFAFFSQYVRIDFVKSRYLRNREKNLDNSRFKDLLSVARNRNTE